MNCPYVAMQFSGHFCVSPRCQRVAGLHEWQIWMSDDFNEPLPDEFWIEDDR